MSTDLVLRIFDVEHGGCALVVGPNQHLAMIDCGHNSETGWRPSTYLRNELGVSTLHYLFVTNADRDHLSDAAGFAQQRINVQTLVRSPNPLAPTLRLIKEAEGPLSEGVAKYLDMHQNYWGPYVPFDQGMGGATCATFVNRFGYGEGEFADTNNLSMVTFIKYAGVKFLFPGDIEKAGWRQMLKTPAFREELKLTDILVASHHGRDNGFCEDIFAYFRPQLVVISDTGVKYGTQETVPDYRDVIKHENGVGVQCGNTVRQRHVLTTRSDGDIIFRVTENGYFTVATTRDKYSKAA